MLLLLLLLAVVVVVVIYERPVRMNEIVKLAQQLSSSSHCRELHHISYATLFCSCFFLLMLLLLLSSLFFMLCLLRFWFRLSRLFSVFVQETQKENLQVCNACIRHEYQIEESKST